KVMLPVSIVIGCPPTIWIFGDVPLTLKIDVNVPSPLSSGAELVATPDCVNSIDLPVEGFVNTVVELPATISAPFASSRKTPLAEFTTVTSIPQMVSLPAEVGGMYKRSTVAGLAATPPAGSASATRSAPPANANKTFRIFASVSRCVGRDERKAGEWPISSGNALVLAKANERSITEVPGVGWFAPT